MSEMFCFQCEQTANGTGCTKIGVCGKNSTISRLQDLMIYQLKGISYYAQRLIEQGKNIEKDIIKFIENTLFTTLTNVNFDLDTHIKILKESKKIKENLRLTLNEENTKCEQATYNMSDTLEKMLEEAKKAGIMYDNTLNEDIRSLRETITYGLKGISAYGHQARILGYFDEEVDKFYIKALDFITREDNKLEELIALAMETGEKSVAIMKTLDEANTSIYKNPVPTKVNVNVKKGPFIIVSGHDLKDLEMLLEQTKDKGINIYTHGEMIPSHAYPELKKYSHLVGNFGSAWQNQQKEFDNLKGCMLMTTNCIMKPRDSYKDRIFTTSVVGWDDIKYIGADENGYKDFSPIIEKALELGGFEEDQEVKEVIVGFGRNALLENANTIVEMVKSNEIKHFFLIGGCDGARKERQYYTDFAKSVPKDCVILTLACGKYRFNKLDFGQIGAIPRLLDVGQCNDAYSAVKIALALADAFNTDVNSLPLSIILSWYEQKAVADLLALLSLGIKGMYIGPTLPAFLSKNVLNYLMETFDLKPITTVEEDLANCLKN